MAGFSLFQLSLDKRLDILIQEQDKLIEQIKIQLDFDVLGYVSNLPYSWDEIMNATGNKGDELIDAIKNIFLKPCNMAKQHSNDKWWESMLTFMNAFYKVSDADSIQVMNLPANYKEITENAIKPYFTKKRNDDYFKVCVFLLEFYSIIRFEIE